MKLLLNAAFDTKTAVGISRYIRRVVPPLARLCDVTVLTPDPEIFADVCKVVRAPELTRFNNRKVIWALTSLRGFCTGRYDVLLSATPAVPPMVRLPTVAVVHDLTPLVMNRVHPPRCKVFFWLPLQTLRWASAVVCDSHNTRKDLLEHRLVPAKRVHVVPLGPGVLPPSRSAPAGSISPATQLRPYILYVGGHVPHKNVALLLAAFSRLVVPRNTRLVIVGWGTAQQVAATKATVHRLGLADRVVLLADLPDPELSELYRQCSLFVFPSLYEGFGLPVLEALAHGAPVACSRTSSLPEVAGDAALYFDPLSVRDIAEKMQLLWDDAKLRGELRSLGLARTGRYSWEKTARGIYDVIATLGSARSGNRSRTEARASGAAG